MAGFGDEEMRIGDLGADGNVVLRGGSGRLDQGNGAGGIIFQGTNVKFVFLDIFQMEISQFRNAQTGLQQQFHNGGHADIQADGVPQRFVFSESKNAGSGSLIFGMG